MRLVTLKFIQANNIAIIHVYIFPGEFADNLLFPRANDH